MKNNRKKSREVAMSILYEYSVTGRDDLVSMLEWHMEENDCALDSAYISSVVEAFMRHSEEIDEAIRSKLVKWTLNRIPDVDRAVLRLAVTEMRYMEEIPPKVSIFEAVKLAQKFSEEKSHEYINAVLKHFLPKSEPSQ